MELIYFIIGLGVLTLIVGIWGYWDYRRESKKQQIMEAIIVSLVFCAFGLGLYIFDHTKAGKKFFGSE